MNLSVAHRGEWICWLLRSYSRRGFRGFDSNILLCLNIFLSESDDGAGEGRTVTSKVTTADHKPNNRVSMITKQWIYYIYYLFKSKMDPKQWIYYIYYLFKSKIVADKNII